MESVVIRAGEKRRAGKRAETGEESSVSLPSREIPRGKGEKMVGGFSSSSSAIERREKNPSEWKEISLKFPAGD